ncbi:helix-turn-helix transcriptional regulator [Vagococcus coleopterorum]|uniref:Helix-turn-helix transcriptional regulator n=1 Tax=Vagococcus coleopterorum TaxID=2714946 RepID=A0A6G8AMB6_9ENTE|nr:helix-turn-helix transcriptional regulator [Vagococcus coleopterorum]QIL46221.1 helix-turn-helix transcriptional regulator [Vagococcus coleopterorum]
MTNNVKSHRLAIDMTQAELAKHVKVSARTIISLEQGKYKPSIMLAYRLALLFNTTIEDLFNLPDNLKMEDNTDENTK